MTEEEYFRKHYPDFCYGDKPLSPYWDFFQDGVEFGERQFEKKIEELEKENAELKDYRLKTLKEQQTGTQKYALNLEHKLSWYDTQLAQAKGHIKQLLDCLRQDTNDPQTNYYVCQYMDKAEQFLKDIKEDK